MKKFIATLIAAMLLVTIPVSALDYTSTETVKQVQEALNNAGYDCGTPDGVAGTMTKSQIEKYRSDKGLTAGTEIDAELCQSLWLEKAEEPEAEADQEAHLDFEDKSDGSFFKGMTITAAEVRQIYEEYEKAWETYPDDLDLAEKYEEETAQKIAEAHGITPQQADNVYFYVIMYGLPDTAKTFTLKHGKLLDTKSNGTTLVLKAKISPSYSNKATIDQNYFNVCDIIKNQKGDTYDEIQYWAVADMTDGSESKVISFTVPKSVIQAVAADKIVENKLGDSLTDLWVLPSLQK